MGSLPPGWQWLGIDRSNIRANRLPDQAELDQTVT
jgi:hypothetical protein